MTDVVNVFFSQHIFAVMILVFQLLMIEAFVDSIKSAGGLGALACRSPLPGHNCGR